MEIEVVPLEDLELDPTNARTHGPKNMDAIKASLATFDQVEPLVVRADSNVVVGGNGRLLAMRDLGWESARVVRVDVTDEQARALGLALNRTGDLAGYDSDRLVETLQELSGAEFAEGIVAGLGDWSDVLSFDVKELKAIVADSSVGQAEVVQDEVPEPPKTPVTKLGDVWEMGDHRVVCGDSSNEAIVSHNIDMLFTSPPYNVDIQYGQHDDSHKTAAEYIGWLASVCKPWAAMLRDGRALVWNIGVSSRTFPHRQVVMLEDVGLRFVRQYVWAKVGIPIPTWHVSQKRCVARHVKSNFAHEMLYVMAKGELEYGNACELSDELRDDVIHIRQTDASKDTPAGIYRSGQGKNTVLNRKQNKAHPAMFPVSLPASFMKCYSAKDECIADPFLGSGTTLIAAEQLNRKCYGIEISPAYCDVVVERWQQLTGGKARRISS
jgi:DNA modification methylase